MKFAQQIVSQRQLGIQRNGLAGILFGNGIEALPQQHAGQNPEPPGRILLCDTKPSRVRCSGRAARCWRFLICEESPELHRPCPNQTSSWRWPVPAGPPQLPFDLERRAGAPTATNTAETT